MDISYQLDNNQNYKFKINEPDFSTRKINNIDEITMEDFFNLGNRIDIKINISNEELKKLQADYETGYKSEIYRLASKVVITLTNFGNKYTWEYENVGIRQKGNTSRIPIYNGDGNINLKITKYALNKLEIDELGLDETDRKILEIMIRFFHCLKYHLRAICFLHQEIWMGI